jgi:hypothetical protein
LGRTWLDLSGEYCYHATAFSHRGDPAAWTGPMGWTGKKKRSFPDQMAGSCNNIGLRQFDGDSVSRFNKLTRAVAHRPFRTERGAFGCGQAGQPT